MNARRPLPPIELLEALFILDAERGLLIRRVTRAHNAKAGDVVGTLDGKGYLHVNITGHFYRVHRIIYRMHYGYEPDSHIDHRDLNRRNNRPENLRPCDDQQNAGNIAPPRHNTSGIKGVYRHSRGAKWCAQIKLSGVTTYLGIYDTKEEAAEAYRRAAVKHFGEYARTHVG